MVNGAKLFSPFDLPNGFRLKNRLIKSAMSDMLGDGRGNPTPKQIALYARWAEGGVAASIIGEMQSDPMHPEASGNLVLGGDADTAAFQRLAHAGRQNNSAIWAQLGHAGAMTPPSLGDPAGPSALELPQLRARQFTMAEFTAFPLSFANAAARAEALGFGGVEIHAAHGFLLSQFLSPLFNRRDDAYGGALVNRMRLLIETIDAVRAQVSPGFTVALKLNSSDGLAGGFEADEAIKVISALEKRGLDLIDISGGTYSPGAVASSDRTAKGPYFLDFAAAARRATDIPLMITGGFKQRSDATMALDLGHVDMIGLARSLVLNPSLPNAWQQTEGDVTFPVFDHTARGGTTAWYTAAIRALAEGSMPNTSLGINDALRANETLCHELDSIWRRTFGRPTGLVE